MRECIRAEKKMCEGRLIRYVDEFGMQGVARIILIIIFFFFLFLHKGELCIVSSTHAEKIIITTFDPSSTQQFIRIICDRMWQWHNNVTIE